MPPNAEGMPGLRRWWTKYDLEIPHERNTDGGCRLHDEIASQDTSHLYDEGQFQNFCRFFILNPDRARSDSFLRKFPGVRSKPWRHQLFMAFLLLQIANATGGICYQDMPGSGKVSQITGSTLESSV